MAEYTKVLVRAMIISRYGAESSVMDRLVHPRSLFGPFAYRKKIHLCRPSARFSSECLAILCSLRFSNWRPRAKAKR